jgi:hypothetical protein
METKMTLEQMFENGNHPIFFEKGNSNRDIRDNQVDVWAPFEYSHKYACTVNKQYAYKMSKKHGYKFSELKKAYSGEEGTIVFPEAAPVEAAPVVEESAAEAKPILTKEKADALRESMAEFPDPNERDERKIKKADKAMKKNLEEAGIDENFDYDDLEQRRKYLECLRKANEEINPVESNEESNNE